MSDPWPREPKAAPAGERGNNEESELRVRLADAEDQRLRALADSNNLRKRCATQVSRARAEASSTVAAEWLPVVDNLDRALSHARAEPDPIIEGVKAVREQALAVLDGLGFGRRAETGGKFDPARHEAVATRLDPDTEPDTVIEVVRAGYGEGDHQLRPAQVVVARRPGLRRSSAAVHRRLVGGQLREWNVIGDRSGVGRRNYPVCSLRQEEPGAGGGRWDTELRELPQAAAVGGGCG